MTRVRGRLDSLGAFVTAPVAVALLVGGTATATHDAATTGRW